MLLIIISYGEEDDDGFLVDKTRYWPFPKSPHRVQLTLILTRLVPLYTFFYTNWRVIPLGNFSWRYQRYFRRDCHSLFLLPIAQIFLPSQIKCCPPPEVCQACPSSQFSNPSLIYRELVLPAWQIRKEGNKHLSSCYHMPETVLGTDCDSSNSPKHSFYILRNQELRVGTDLLRVILVSDQDLNTNLCNSTVLHSVPHHETTRYQEKKAAGL